jgi:hypothetical protein
MNIRLALTVLISTSIGVYISRKIGISNDYLKLIPFALFFSFSGYLLYSIFNKYTAKK